MRNLPLPLLIAAALLLNLASACENDDSDFSDYTLTTPGSADSDDDGDGDGTGSTPAGSTDTISIVWSGTTATVSGDSRGYVTLTGADVTLTDATPKDAARDLVLVLSGTTADGSLLVYRQKKYTIVLSGLSLTNADGPAINNQCGKALYVTCADGTTNSLADGTAYAERAFDQKGTLFSEGQLYFGGSGSLTVDGNCKNAIASDDYITIDGDITLKATTSKTGTNGLKANDGVFILGGNTTISVASAGGRGIRSEARTTVSGGNTTISTTGNCKIETTLGVADTTSAACIKSDSLFTMTAGTLTLTSTGDGGKGLRCAEDIVISGGTFTARTTGSNDDAKPKAVKSNTGIILSGGSFSASVKKSWACDNGTDSEQPQDHLTVVGTPSSASITKKSVVVTF